MRAFEVNALDYLLKPIAPARLSEAIARIAARGRPLSRLFLRDGERCWIVDAAEVALLESEGRFTRLAQAALQEPPRVRAMLGALGEELGAPPRDLKRLRASLSPLSRFDFGTLRDLRCARDWQAK